MALLLSRLVVLAAAVVVALPPGWCCLARTGCCGGHTKPQPQAANAPVDEKTECCGCCNGAAPTGPSIGNGDCCTPAAPAKACCCERTHSTKQTPSPQLPLELPALATIFPVAYASASPTRASATLSE